MSSRRRCLPRRQKAKLQSLQAKNVSCNYPDGKSASSFLHYDPPNQVRELRQIAERRGWEVVEQFSDAGISGSESSIEWTAGCRCTIFVKSERWPRQRYRQIAQRNRRKE